jgi:hypothetical protein
MRRMGGVIAWIDARRLDRALMRFEAAVDGGASPLQVLAALDLVMVVTDLGAPRVMEIAEIDLVEDGYRPRLVFASGLPPVPNVLVPVAAPSFVAELVQAGLGVLADELRHAVPSRNETRAAPEPRKAAPRAEPREAREPRENREPRAEPRESREPRVEPRESRESRIEPRQDILEAAAAAAPAPQIDQSLADAPPPGWELDQVPDDQLGPGESGTASPDDATLAAAFGLGPPPRPPGVRPGQESRTFEDALRRARAREQEQADELPPPQDDDA